MPYRDDEDNKLGFEAFLCHVPPVTEEEREFKFIASDYIVSAVLVTHIQWNIYVVASVIASTRKSRDRTRSKQPVRLPSLSVHFVQNICGFANEIQRSETADRREALPPDCTSAARDAVPGTGESEHLRERSGLNGREKARRRGSETGMTWWHTWTRKRHYCAYLSLVDREERWANECMTHYLYDGNQSLN